MNKKILITSIPSWNQKTGSNTFSSLFDFFDNNDLANIYISGDIPDSNVCSRYYHINEMSVIRSVLNRKIETGEEIHINNSTTTTSYNIPKKQIRRTRLTLWARELAWKFGLWDSKGLKAFLRDFHPEVLVFPIESYPYFNRLNKFIIRYCKPTKIIGYLWDDNFTYKQYPHCWIAKIERYFLRKQIKPLIKSCTDVLAISPKMKEECDAEFRTNCIILTKPILNQSIFKPVITGSPIKILYTGKLIIGREHTIAKIAAALKEVNGNSQKAVLDVYTNTVLSNKLRKQIDIPGCCRLHDPIPQSKVAALLREADVLLFVESLSDKNLTARLSFSTKLTDYFAAGKCIWAVGNSDLGPISYIEDEKAGLVSHDEKSIKEILQMIISNPSLISDYAQKGYECGKRNHNRKLITQKLKELIE